MLKNILHDYGTALKTYESQETWTRWLDSRDSEELQFVLDNWQWPERRIQKRLLEQNLSRRFQAARRHFEKALKCFTKAEAIFSLLPGNLLKQSEISSEVREVLQQTNGLIDPTLTQAPRFEEEQLSTTFGEPTWWQQHKNQVYVGLLVGMPSVVLGLLALIFG